MDLNKPELNRLTLIHYMVSEAETEEEMVQSGLKPPPPLVLDVIAMNWRAWISVYEIYAGAAGVTSKVEKTQCFTFLHVAGSDAQKLFRTLHIEVFGQGHDKDKIKPLVQAFKHYCEVKENQTVTRYQFNTYQQTTERMDMCIRELQHRISFCEYGVIEDSLL